MSKLHVTLLMRAAEILGGTEELASFLGVSQVRLRIWMRGILTPPDAIFLKLADLIEANAPVAQPNPQARARIS